MDLATELLQTIADRLTGLEQLNQKFDVLNGKFDLLNGKFDLLNGKFDLLNGKFGDLNAEFDGLNGKFDGLTQTVAANGNRLDRLEVLAEATHTTLLGMAQQNRFVVRYLKTLAERDSELGTEVSSLKRRVDALEEHTGLKDEI